MGPKVSIILATYNSDLEKTKESLLSCMEQEGIDIEIIIADDGSKDSREEELKVFFKENDFDRFSMVMNKENHGTVKNLLSGTEKAKGQYVKFLSPGDLLLGKDLLKDWVSRTEEKEAAWSFCDVLCYHMENGKKVITEEYGHPQDLSAYLKKDAERAMWNYIVLMDTAIGAAVLGKTKSVKKYLKEVSEAGVIYTEDNIWRLMFFDGHRGIFYGSGKVLYEYGDGGISTSGNDKWAKRIRDDNHKTDEIIINRVVTDPFKKKIQNYLAKDVPTSEKLLTKYNLGYYIKTKLFTRKTAKE